VSFGGVPVPSARSRLLVPDFRKPLRLCAGAGTDGLTMWLSAVAPAAGTPCSRGGSPARASVFSVILVVERMS
jgi:hypothetical protein